MNSLLEEWFEPHIIERGYDYYMSGRVYDITREGTHYSAIVSGGDEYYVEIEMAEGGLAAGMSCSCPYAERGLNCKHMAAVLFALDEVKNHEVAIKGANPLDELSDVMQKIGEEEALNFLLEHLHLSGELFQAFRNRYISYFSQVSVDQYINRIKRAFRDHTRYEGYVSYRRASSFLSDIMRFCGEMDDLIGAEEYAIPLEMGITILEELRRLSLDDSDGTTSTIVDRCCELLHSIAQECEDLKVLEELFNWLCNGIRQQDLDYFEDGVRNLFTEDFSGREYLSRKMEVVESRLQTALNEKESFIREYELTTWILVKADFMKKSGATKEEIAGLLDEFIYLDIVRQRVIDEHVKEGDYTRAICLLKEGKQANSVTQRHYPGAVRRYSEQLLALYKLIGDQEAYKEELYDMLYNYDKGDIHVYRQIKCLYADEEWVHQRERIICKLSSQSSYRVDLAPIYAEEEMLDRLFACVLSSGSLYALREYEDILKCEYPEELLRIYEEKVRMEAESVSNRSKYRQIASILNHMRGYPNGDHVVDKILKEFRTKYRMRRAMQEELNQVEAGP